MYSHVTRKVDQDSWHHILDGFQDATVLQTITFSEVTLKRAEVEQFLVYKNSELVAAAQVRLIPTPFLGKGLAYVLWGPLWQRYKSKPNVDVLRHVIRLMKEEYVAGRGMSLRINPKLITEEGYEYAAIFLEEGYRQGSPGKQRRSIVINLEQPLNELRKGLDQKWRNCLNRAEKNNLELVEGSDDAMFDLFLPMYRQMLSRKGIAEPGNIQAFRVMQHRLPARHKMNAIVAMDQGQASAGAICSAIGGAGIYLFGATADVGMKNKAAYLVQWKVIEWLKELDCSEYDLHGINPELNPGVYAFKKGLSGRNGREVEFIGIFDAYRCITAKILLNMTDVIRGQRNRLKSLYGRYRGFSG